MVQLKAIDDIKKTVESSYPFALSTVFSRYRRSKKEDLGGRYKKLIELFEVFIKFIASIQLQDIRQQSSNFVERLPQKEKSLQFLKRPSLGGWLGLIRMLSGITNELPGDCYAARIAQWYNQGRNEENSAILQEFKNIEEINFQTKTKKPVAEICNAMVTIRNKLFGHGSMLSESKISAYLPVIERIMAFLFASTAFVSELKMVFVEKRELSESDEWILHLVQLNGLTEERFSVEYPEKLEAKELYLCEINNETIVSQPIRLGPFLVWQTNEDLKKSEVYFYNDAMRTKLEYVSYSSGAFYYHKELHTDFEKLISLHLKSSEEDASLKHLSPEERALRAEENLKKATVLFNKGLLEDGLEVVENAIEYDRRPEMFVLKATIENELEEHPEVIMQTLDQALEIDSTYKDAIEFLSRLQKRNEPENISGHVHAIEPEAIGTGMESPTFFHAVTPRIFRKYTAVFLTILAMAWFAFSFTFEALAGSSLDVFIGIAGIFVAVIVFSLGLPTVRTIVIKLKLPLSLQLAKMRLDRFEGWYKANQEMLFGKIIFKQGTFKFWQTVKAEPLYYSIFIAGYFSLMLLIMQASNSHTLPPIHFTKRLVDYSIIILTLIPCVRYVILSTFFVLNYSKLSIKPMLSKINDDGLRSFGPFMSFNVFLATSANTAFFMGASFMNKGSILMDFPILAAISVVVMFWSIGMPYTIYRAAKSAKFHAIHAYADKIEDSFRNFIENPGEESLAEYQWLLKNQKVIKKISSWPLSFTETLLFVVGSNILLVFVNIWFVLKRTGLLQQLMDYLEQGIF